MHGIDPLKPGSLLAGRYRIGEPLGNGGMSFVHRGTDEVLGREVAVKALVQAAVDTAEQQRVQSEIDLLATLSHRALVTLFDAGSTVLDGREVTYLVMELVDGPTLAERTAQEPLAPAAIRRMAMDLTEALVVVHARGVVHRDIKPANILLAPSPLPGQAFDAKLADFGIAAIVDAARVTATGTVLGTAAYLSPEQATGARVGPASDIYSLGLVLLETITGHREYPGSMLESLVARPARDPDVPHAIDDDRESLLTAMTAREPDARPTAAQVLERLAAAPETAPVPLLDGDGAATAAAPAAAAAGTALLDAQPAAAAGAAAGPGAAAAGAAAAMPLGEDAAVDTKELAAAPDRRRRRGWMIAATVTAGVALLATALAFALQGIAFPEPSSTPTVAETSQPPVETDDEPSGSPTAPAPTGDTATDVDGDQGDGDEPAPTTEPTPTESAPTEPAPEQPEPTDPAPTEPAPTAPPSPEPTQPPSPPAEPSSSPPPPDEGSNG